MRNPDVSIRVVFFSLHLGLLRLRRAPWENILNVDLDRRKGGEERWSGGEGRMCQHRLAGLKGSLLRADQKAKARQNLSLSTAPSTLSLNDRARNGSNSNSNNDSNALAAPDTALLDAREQARSYLETHEPDSPSPCSSSASFASTLAQTSVRADDMVYFWQCQSPGNTGELKGCGFFRVLDMGKEGRGPCWGDVVRPSRI